MARILNWITPPVSSGTGSEAGITTVPASGLELQAFRAIKEAEESVDWEKYAELRQRHTRDELVDTYLRWMREKFRKCEK